MASDPDAERRKARDAVLRTQDEEIARHLAQALRSGELQSAPSFGKPLEEAEGWNETPEEFRQSFKILKNAGILPPEIELFHKRAALREELAACTNDAARADAQRGGAEALHLRTEIDEQLRHHLDIADARHVLEHALFRGEQAGGQKRERGVLVAFDVDGARQPGTTLNEQR